MFLYLNFTSIIVYHTERSLFLIMSLVMSQSRSVHQHLPVWQPLSQIRDIRLCRTSSFRTVGKFWTYDIGCYVRSHLCYNILTQSLKHTKMFSSAEKTVKYFKLSQISFIWSFGHKIKAFLSFSWEASGIKTLAVNGEGSLLSPTWRLRMTQQD